MAASERKSVNSPDERRPFGHGRIDLVEIGGGHVGRSILEPGWRWSQDVKPIAKTESCQAAHFGYVLSGRMTVKMDDGTEINYEAGDVAVIPPGHDAWVVGYDSVEFLDWAGAANYAQQQQERRAA